MARKTKVRNLTDRDWDNLLTLAAGYLASTGGDARRAMAKALVAHHDLILAAKQGAISADVSDGRITLMVPEGGGMALKTEIL